MFSPFFTWSGSPVNELSSTFKSLLWRITPSAGSRSPVNKNHKNITCNTKKWKLKVRLEYGRWLRDIDNGPGLDMQTNRYQLSGLKLKQLHLRTKVLVSNFLWWDSTCILLRRLTLRRCSCLLLSSFQLNTN